MPKQKYSPGHYATATKQVIHGDPCVEGGVSGIAFKQKAPAWDLPFANQKIIIIGEDFLILDKGEVEVAALGGAVKGQAVYITTATNALTLSVPGAGLGFPFGRVAELPGQRGTPATKMMVDQDAKANINTP